MHEPQHLEIKPTGKVFLNGMELKTCFKVDIENLNPVDAMNVTIHLTVDRVDVNYSNESRNELRQET